MSPVLYALDKSWPMKSIYVDLCRITLFRVQSPYICSQDALMEE